MKYIEKDGTITEKDSSQDKLLHWLYTHRTGRGLIQFLIQPWVSKIAGWFLNQKCSTFLIQPFIKKNHIDMQLYEKQEYKSYNEFFYRQIRRESRPLGGGKGTLISPCDGKLSVYPITKESCFDIKDTMYSLESLLRSPNLAQKYEGGYACVFRLTVDDYHRYCYVDSGKKSRNHHISGVFHTVNPVANDAYPIYKENTREYSLLKSDHFKTILMMEVGALLVGRIKNHQEDAKVERGQEKGWFEFGGSTVVLLFQKDAVRLEERLLKNTRNGYETIVKMGEKIGCKMELL